jgi:hypothetical protein
MIDVREVDMLRRTIPICVLVSVLWAPFAVRGVAQSQAQPREPIAAILDAFKTHQVVAVPDAHRDTAMQASLLALIRDRRFPTVVNDIVVEFGNARYQDLVDRFVRGEDIPYELLQKIWLDTTQAQPIWDTPQPEEVLRAVRAINAAVPRDQQVRVLLGDPPIDWNDVKTKADHLKWIGMRETFPADIVRREVLAKRRRALIMYGVMHLQRKNAQANFESTGPAASLVSILEDSGVTRTFNVGLILDLAKAYPYTVSWPAPSLVILRGTTIGAAPLAYDGPRVTVQAGQIVPVPREQWRSMRMEDQYDAILYLGPPAISSVAMVSPALCADPSYAEMRSRRMALAEWKTDQFEDYCGRVRPIGQ